jgi:hypothetical protein
MNARGTAPSEYFTQFQFGRKSRQGDYSHGRKALEAAREGFVAGLNA